MERSKREEWFRRTTWNAQVEEAFQARLKRSRSVEGKAQYLRIQAGHLAEVGNHSVALALLEQLLRDFPAPFELASSLLLRGEILAAMDRDDEALASFRASLDAQAKRPNHQVGVELKFALFIVMRRLFHLYEEAQSLIRQYAEQAGTLLFPSDRFWCAAMLAIIADDLGQAERGRTFATAASKAAAAVHSGFRYHPTAGLVRNVPKDILARLAKITENS